MILAYFTTGTSYAFSLPPLLGLEEEEWFPNAKVHRRFLIELVQKSEDVTAVTWLGLWKASKVAKSILIHPHTKQDLYKY